MNYRTWQATASVTRTPVLALAMLVVFALSCELAARIPLVRSRLHPPGVGSPSRPFELQLARLDAFVASQGGVDCIFVGSSLALLGFDPDAFSAAYRRRTGRRIRCFDFGVPALTASSVGAIARILAEDYHPWLLIYGIGARDLSAAADNPRLTDIP